ncbi:MAG: BlaI/MecI/CopY family transcriptional regulator [Eubacterium sp.]|nr:BlaI/MecI/CopY family transcriptional regulator [Eubacterium sp.]
MQELSLGEIESRFADMIWEKEPIKTSDLLKLCADAFGWKRSTTYTVLKRLEKKGLFENQDGTVVSLLSREAFYSKQSEQYVEQSFGGSLPAFLAAFTSGKKLSDKEIQELKQIIEDASK